ncbi:MAG: TonB-dependent receptor, partial [Terriglobia bacterium]
MSLPALSWTHTLTPSMVNEVRIGVSRLHTTRTGPVASQMGIPGQYGIADIPQFPENGGLPAFSFNGLSTIGSNNFLPSDEVSQTTQVTDNFTKIYGKHTFKMGIEYQRVRYSTLQPPFSHGQWNYDGDYTRVPQGQSYSTGIGQMLLTPGATTLPSSVAYALPYDGGADGADISNIARTDDGKNYWGSFFEDDWKVSSKLTLNLGLRWDYFGQTFERFGAQANFIPGYNGSPAEFLIPVQRESDVLSSSFLQLTAKDGINVVYSRKRGLGNSQRDNFGPRIGFAYQWSPKLVMRGGYGMFYDGFE